MIGDEFNEIIANGEFAEPIKVIYDNVEYNDVKGFVQRSWKRKEVDGALTIDLPRNMTTFLISKSSLPAIILDDDRLTDMLFEVDGILFEVLYVVGFDLLSFTVTVHTEHPIIEDDEDETEEDSTIPGLVI